MRILNCGCGTQTYGTDFLDLYPQREEVKRWNDDIERIPYPDNTFDIVFSRNLLEHIRNLEFVTSEFARVTKQGGVVRIETDNARYWRWVLEFGRVQPHKYGGYHSLYGGEDHHYCIFYPSHVRQLLEAQNLKVTYEGWRLTDKRMKKIDRLMSMIRPNLAYPIIVAEAIKS